METENEICRLADSLADKALNTGREEFLRQLRMMHRTSQQIFAGLVLEWLQDYTRNYPVDDRNRCSVEYCRKILDAFWAAYPGEQFRTRFPCI